MVTRMQHNFRGSIEREWSRGDQGGAGFECILDIWHMLVKDRITSDLCDSDIVCDLAQKRPFQMYVDLIYAWLYMGVWLSDCR